MTSAEVREKAIQRVVGGEDATSVAADMGLDSGAVAEWAKAWRDAEIFRLFMSKLEGAGAVEGLKALAPIVERMMERQSATNSDPVLAAISVLRSEWDS